MKINTENKVLSIQGEFAFGDYPIIAIHRVNGSRLYHNVTDSSWIRCLSLFKYFNHKREDCKIGEFQFWI